MVGEDSGLDVAGKRGSIEKGRRRSEKGRRRSEKGRGKVRSGRVDNRLASVGVHGLN